MYVVQLVGLIFEAAICNTDMVAHGGVHGWAFRANYHRFLALNSDYLHLTSLNLT